MDHFELVEKLRERTGVSYEDAKAALEAANWDLLDAIVILETEGKIAQGAKDYSTRREERKEEREHKQRRSDFRGTMGRIGNQLVYLINKGNQIMIDVSRGGKVVFSLPLTVLALLLIFMFWVTIPLLIIGLFFGFTYSIRGSGAGAGVVNQAMEKASEFANNIKQEVENNGKNGNKE